MPEFPTKALLVIRRDSSRLTPKRSKDLAAMKKLLSGRDMQAKGEDLEILKVQYNPSTLTISANASAIQTKSMQTFSDPSIQTQKERPPSVVLEVDLIFDEINPKDAFMADKLRMSAGDVASTVAAFTKGSGSGGYSVAAQISGLAGMMLDRNTRNVTFLWQDMMFMGVVSEMRNSYTMFNMSGNPIRGTVRMNITQNVDIEGEAHWSQALDHCFVQSAAGKNILEQAASLTSLNF